MVFTERRQRTYPAADWRIGQVKSLLGGLLLSQRRFDEPERLLAEATAVLEPGPGAQGREAAAAQARLARLKAAPIGRR